MALADHGYRGSVLPGIHGTVQSDMEAFDRLGPLTKAALNDITFKFCAQNLVHWCDARGLDPRDPVLDARLAATVYRDEKIGIASDPQCA